MRVRRAIAGDEDRLRSVRLAALADSPGAFASTYEREVAYTDDRWRDWIGSGATFFVEGADEETIGLVAAVTDREDPAAARIISMWLHPSARETGAADALLRAALSWAGEARFAAARLCVIEGNIAARCVYERHGFRLTGACGDELTMERSLTS